MLIEEFNLFLSERKSLSLLLLVLSHFSGTTLLEGLSWSTGPVILGLGHSVSKSVLVLGPVLAEVGSTLGVPVGVILENSDLGNILSVVFLLLSDLSLADFVVLLGGQSRWDI